MRARARRRGSAAGVLLSLAVGCAAPEAGPSGSLLLVTIDTLRADHSSAYGYARDTTPELRELAADGVRFDQAYAPGPITGPTHSTLFTGLFPIGHGVVRNGLALDADHRTLAELLRERGYQTAAIVSSFALHGKFGYGQGFERFEDDFAPATSSIARRRWEGHRVPEGFDRPARPTTERALRWLDETRDPRRPFFLFVHYFDPHSPYLAPRPFRRFAPEGGGEVARAVALYDAEVAYADLALGSLLAALDERGLARDTLVAVAGDHGEGLRDHGYMFHDFQLYEEAVRVPLVLRWPGRIAAGRVVRTPTSLVDLMPTLLELLGVPAPPDLQGRSRAADLVGRAPAADPERPIFLQRRPFDPTEIAGFEVAGTAFAIRAGRWKYIEAPAEGRRELYDLEADPAERENLATRHPEVVETLSARIGAWRGENARAAAAGTSGISEQDRERLRAMGYAD